MTSPRFARVSTALLAAVAATILVSGAALAHPESEGEHPGGCVVTVEPGSVAVGQQFTVAGNFGGADIYIVEGADTSTAEGASPDASTPAGSSFSVTFTADDSDIGENTVWGVLEGSECGDSDSLTVTALLPDAAMPMASDWIALPAVVLLLVGAGLIADRVNRSAW